MRTGSFEAVGFELERAHDWQFVVGNVLFLQVFALIALIELRIIQSDLAALGASSVIAGVGVVMLWLIRMSRGNPSRMRVDWINGRESPGVLEVSYVGPRNKRRVELVVENIEVRPNDALLGPGTSRYMPVVPANGTQSSIILNFRSTKKFSLGLGFPTADVMQRTYDELKG